MHATIDLGGRVRFGPDVEYVEIIDYRVDEGKRDAFHESILTYLPLLAKESLNPDMSGIRPKLQGPGEDIRDFVIREESRLGSPAGSISSGSSRRGSRPALPSRSGWHA